MRFIQPIKVAAIAVALSLTSSAALAKGPVDAPDGPWTHKATGAVLPDEAAGTKRTGINEYDDDGRNASASYFLENDNGGLLLTIYLYPAAKGEDCDAAFEGVTAAIFDYDGAVITSLGKPKVPWSNRSASALYARFKIPENSMREGYPEAVSDAFLYCPAGNDWLVKYRATWFGTEDNFPDLTEFLNAVEWPDKLK